MCVVLDKYDERVCLIHETDRVYGVLSTVYSYTVVVVRQVSDVPCRAIQKKEVGRQIDIPFQPGLHTTLTRPADHFQTRSIFSTFCRGLIKSREQCQWLALYSVRVRNTEYGILGRELV